MCDTNLRAPHMVPSINLCSENIFSLTHCLVPFCRELLLCSEMSVLTAEDNGMERPSPSLHERQASEVASHMCDCCECPKRDVLGLVARGLARGPCVWDSPLEKLTLEPNLQEGDKLALNERKQEERDIAGRGVTHEVLGNDTCMVYGGGVTSSRGLQECCVLLCSCSALGREARQALKTSAGKLSCHLGKPCGFLPLPKPYHCGTCAPGARCSCSSWFFLGPSSTRWGPNCLASLSSLTLWPVLLFVRQTRKASLGEAERSLHASLPRDQTGGQQVHLD